MTYAAKIDGTSLRAINREADATKDEIVVSTPPQACSAWNGTAWIVDASRLTKAQIIAIESAGPPIPRRVWRDLIAGMVKAGFLARDLPIVIAAAAEEAEIAPLLKALK